MDILKEVKATLIRGDEKQVIEDCMYILIWVVSTKFEGLLNLPPRNEMVDQVTNKKITIEANKDSLGGCLRVRDI